MKIVVIIPTYKEKDNIAGLTEALENEFAEMLRHSFYILFVDSNSPDGTGEVILRQQKKYGNIRLLAEREKKGLGAAYVAGMNYAMREMSAEALLEFDGDFQHDPRDIKKLVAELDKGYDYIIGSRYVPGGKIPEGWGWFRKSLSRYGGLFIKKMLSLPTRDNTSGFKLSRIDGFAEHMPLEEGKIFSLRHAYKIHLLYEMFRLGARVKEVPISFRERTEGGSKSTREDIWESLKVVFKIRKQWRKS